jgi:hypothetical protein
MRLTALVVMGVASCGLLNGTAAYAQGAAAAGTTVEGGRAEATDQTTPPTTFGTTDPVRYVLNAYAFNVVTSDTTIAGDALGFRWITSGDNRLRAPVMLPAGALINWIEIKGCISDPSGQLTMTAKLLNTNIFDSGERLTQLGQVTAAPVGGCAHWGALVLPAAEVNHGLGSYFVEVTFGSNTDATRLLAVVLGYSLQVSKAPATATFADVPVGHPYHRFVEALNSAGITGGCGGGHYCPNEPVTRGQLAVFLAVALGLHFPF